jgi:D-alanyl-D-alanine carboxypeptidase
MREDIPEALRQSPAEAAQSRSKWALLGWGSVGLGAVALTLGLWLMFQFQRPQASQPPGPIQTQGGSVVPTPPPAPISTPSLPPPELLLGHLPFAEAPDNELRSITADGNIQLRTAAAEQFRAMVIAAQADGVNLVPVSGFRSVAEQKRLFFDVKAQRGQVATERAEVSAPPGYSEHHTGYAVDIGDGSRPEANLSTRFEATAAFQWLQSNAARFSFELSFPQGNPQGVKYEPWHWRFVGDQQSLETFYRSRNLKPGSGTSSSN